MKSVLKYLCVIFLGVFIYVKGQLINILDPPGRPDRCQAPIDLLYRQCCIFPPFFARDIARTCGAIFSLTYIDQNSNATGLKRTAPSGCQHWRCILQRYALLNEDGYVDEEKYYEHLDKWVDLNPEFATVMVGAKSLCKEDYGAFMPLEVCKFSGFQMCIRNYINLDCPITRNTAECHEQREFYDACREFFYKKR